MTTPINLNRARKARARSEDKTRAAENAAKFGRTKAEKHRDRIEALRDETRLDGAKREE